jgi:hypothetical protein
VFRTLVVGYHMFEGPLLRRLRTLSRDKVLFEAHFPADAPDAAVRAAREIVQSCAQVSPFSKRWWCQGMDSFLVFGG